jgi:Zn-finger nucleic acid-binding protein
MILLLLSIIIIILCGVSYLEFKKIKIELDKHKEILSIYKEKIELLLNLNKKLTQERGYNQENTYQENTYQENYVDNQELNNRHIVELDEIVEVADVEIVEEVVDTLVEEPEPTP